MLELLSMPFVQIAIATAIVLTGMHAYLGFHVVSRGVIFVDLSLAQAAAFGAGMASLIGLEEHTIAAYFMSLGFTLLGALLVSIARTRNDRIPHEAFIGIIYAAFSAGLFLLLSHHASGAEELNHLLVGSLLTVQPSELMKVTLLYSAVGVLHWLLRARFFAISQDRAKAIARGWRVGWWDFVFYAVFGVVVTSSVHLAGVLLVFAILVIPPTAALLLSLNNRRRLQIGWGVGALGALLGILMSLKFDLPVGPSIIAALVVLLVVVSTFTSLYQNR